MCSTHCTGEMLHTTSWILRQNLLGATRKTNFHTWNTFNKLFHAFSALRMYSFTLGHWTTNLPSVNQSNLIRFQLVFQPDRSQLCLLVNNSFSQNLIELSSQIIHSVNRSLHFYVTAKNQFDFIPSYFHTCFHMWSEPNIRNITFYHGVSTLFTGLLHH